MSRDITDIIRSILEDEAVYVEELKLSSGGGRMECVLDTDEGIASERLSELSRKIRNNETFIEAGGDDIELELSSPGLDRPLTELRHYRKNINRDLTVEHSLDEPDSPVIGTLVHVSDEEIRLQVKGRGQKLQEYTLPLASVTKAKIKLKW